MNNDALASASQRALEMETVRRTPDQPSSFVVAFFSAVVGSFAGVVLWGTTLFTLPIARSSLLFASVCGAIPSMLIVSGLAAKFPDRWGVIAWVTMSGQAVGSCLLFLFISFGMHAGDDVSDVLVSFVAPAVLCPLAAFGGSRVAIHSRRRPLSK